MQTDTPHEGNEPMNDGQKIAVPLADGKFAAHFGAARQFAFFGVVNEGKGVESIGVFDAPEHKPGVLPVWLAGQSVDAVVASAIGERALILLADSGIVTRIGEENLEPAELAAQCARGNLDRATLQNTRCHDGGHHDHDHDHQGGCNH